MPAFDIEILCCSMASCMLVLSASFIYNTLYTWCTVNKHTHYTALLRSASYICNTLYTWCTVNKHMLRSSDQHHLSVIHNTRGVRLINIHCTLQISISNNFQICALKVVRDRDLGAADTRSTRGCRYRNFLLLQSFGIVYTHLPPHTLYNSFSSFSPHFLNQLIPTEHL